MSPSESQERPENPNAPTVRQLELTEFARRVQHAPVLNWMRLRPGQAGKRKEHGHTNPFYVGQRDLK